MGSLQLLMAVWVRHKQTATHVIMSLRKYLEILTAQKRPVRFLASRLICWLGLARLFQIRCDGFRLRLHPASISMRLWVEGADRNEDLDLLKKVLRPGDTYIDVGANIGQLCLAASVAVGTQGRVFAFEPHPNTYRFLCDNLQANRSQNIVTVQAAIGEDAGFSKISDGPSDDQNRIGDSGPTIVRLKLEDLFPGISVRLLKIDVEGFEQAVLLGCGGLLDRVETIYCEIYDKNTQRYGYTGASLIELLNSRGFKVFRVEGATLTKVTEQDSFAVCRNLLACRDACSLGRHFTVVV